MITKIFPKGLQFLVCILLFITGYVPAGAHSPSTEITPHQLGTQANLAERRIFLIAVIDSDDKEIGQRCETDLAEMEAVFDEMAFMLEAEMEEPKVIQGDDFGKAAVNEAIDNWLRNAQPGGNDIVVFYYSGHGFRFESDSDEYPRMWLKTKRDQKPENTNLKMSDVYRRIVAMGAGVNLVISDCCNTVTAGESGDFDDIPVPVRPVRPSRQPHGQVDDEDDMEMVSKLFQEPASILVSAAESGELAGGKADIGGFFTHFLVEALYKCIDEEMEPDWTTIFEYVNDKAAYWARSAKCPNARRNDQGRCIQTVMFEVAGM